MVAKSVTLSDVLPECKYFHFIPRKVYRSSSFVGAQLRLTTQSSGLGTKAKYGKGIPTVEDRFIVAT